MISLTYCEVSFLLGMGAGVCLAFVLYAAALSMLDAAAAWREGSDE